MSRSFKNNLFALVTLMTLIVSALGFSSASASITITNGMNATLVLGQSNFTSSTPGLSSTGMSGVRDVAVDPTTGKVFVVDSNNNRVLRFASANALANGAAAEAVLGQANFTSNVAATSQNGMNLPVGASVDSAGRLWVVEQNNHRVVRYDNASSKANGANADGVLGQPNFTSGASATSQSGMFGPTDVFADSSGRVWVSEYNNSRVIRFDNAASKANGANADGVLGQADFTSHSYTVSQNTMNLVWSVYVDSAGTLWAVDQGPRALRFDNAASKANGANADGVLGQPDFTTTGSAVAQNKFSLVSGITGDASGRIYVVEWNHRVMVFNNASSKANGANADNVIGQVDFTSNSAGVTQSKFNYPLQAFFDSAANVLWVAEGTNNRALMFGSIVTASPTVTTDSISTNGNISISATVSDLGYPTPVTAYGVVYNTTGTPTTSDSKVDHGTLAAPGSFTIGGAELTMTPGTKYYVRAFATNTTGTSYGTELVFYGTPGAFTTTAPANNATGVSTSPTLSWNASTGATSYEYCYGLSTEAPFHCMTPTDPGWISTGSATSVVLSGLLTNSQYIWGVRAVVGSPASYKYSSDSPLNFTTTSVVNHTVTFDGNGADGGSMSPQIASSATNLTTNAFTRTGHTFTGWGTVAGGPVVYADGASYDFSADITLYAQWSANGQPSTTFQDVPSDYWAKDFIERLYNAGITGGCGTNPLTYCPEATVTRAQMAIFILRGMHGSAYTPPPATGTVFADVAADAFAADWIEQLAAEGVTGGCGDGNYCPDATVTRAQMAIFLLRGEHGSAYIPPAATGAVYTDIPATAFAADWIEQLAREGVTGGCGGGNYCPDTAVTRAEMAVFIVRAFGLP